MSGDTRIRVGGSWVEPSDILRYSGGAWSSVSEGFARRNGQWMRIWPPRAPQMVETFNSISSDLWHDWSDGWHGSTWGTRPEQGAHPSGSRHRGIWTYGNRPWASTLAQDGGRIVTRLEIFVERVSGHLGWGSTGNVRPRFWCHGYNTRPSHKPSLFGGPYEASSLARGESRWVDLPVQWGQWLVSGRARGFGIYVASSGPVLALRSRDSTVASGRIRITHV